MEKEQVIYGRHPVVDALKSGQPMEKVLLQQGVRGPFERELRQLTKKMNIPLQVTPKERLSKWTRGNHQGVVGLLSPIKYYLLEDVLPGIFERNESPLILILDGVTDVRNLGAIARSAECLGAHALVIPKKGSALINAEGLKTSAGALTKIPVCRENSLASAIGYLKLSGVKIYSSDLQAEKRIQDIDWTGPAGILIGSEGKGVNPALGREADEAFIIPQVGTTDSLNVSVATGIILYEVLRQRKE